MNARKLADLFRRRAALDLEIADALEDDVPGLDVAVDDASEPKAAPAPPARVRRRRLLEPDAQGQEDAAKGLRRAGVYPRAAWQR